MQGIIAATGLTGAAGETNMAGVSLDNGSYVVTASDVVYVAPWYAVQADAQGDTAAFQLVQDQLVISGTAWNFTARIVFSCDSDTINGTVWRRSANTEVDLILPPTHFKFGPGQTEIPFSIKFLPVNDPQIALDMPSWAGALLQRRA